jgi:hypothetical protein
MEENKPNWFIILAFLIFIGIFIIYFIVSYFSPCIHPFDKDKFCMKISDSNLTNSLYHYEEKSHKQIIIDNSNAEKQRKELDKKNKEAQDCFNKGKWYNQSFDILKDYGFNCAKLEYINDHLIDKSRQVDGGYITSDDYGFLGLSRNHVDVHIYQWVTEGILATGQLLKNISYHIDCNNSTLTPDCFDGWYGGDETKLCRSDTKQIDYYTEGEFVMYYVNRCIN